MKFVRLGLAIIPLLMCGCAISQAVPANVMAVWEETNNRVIIPSGANPGWQNRAVQKGERVWGNCSTFATTALLVARERGMKATVRFCRSGATQSIAAVPGSRTFSDRLQSERGDTGLKMEFAHVYAVVESDGKWWKIDYAWNNPTLEEYLCAK